MPCPARSEPSTRMPARARQSSPSTSSRDPIWQALPYGLKALTMGIVALSAIDGQPHKHLSHERAGVFGRRGKSSCPNVLAASTWPDQSPGLPGSVIVSGGPSRRRRRSRVAPPG